MSFAADMHVVLVGVETYGEGISRLSGPATDVLQYATWAISEAGVEPTAVTVFLSESGESDGTVAKELRALGIPEDSVQAATVEAVRKYCTAGLPHRNQKNLLWLWSGHGYFYRETATRVVYVADTSHNDPRVFDVRDLQRFLRLTRIPNLDRQLLLFDVCAEGTHRKHEQVPLPAGHAKYSSRVERFHQTAISAAPEEGSVHTGQFSRLALAVLRTHEGDAWPPPQFQTRLIEKGLRQSHRVFFGDDSEPGDELESPEIQRDLRTALEARKVIAFVGGHARRPPFLDQGDFAEQVAEGARDGYPFRDRRILSSVAEYVARREPGGEVIPILTKALGPQPTADEVKTAERSDHLRILAGLPIEIFLTTAYDSALETALRAHEKDPNVMSYGDGADPGEPTETRPLVYHLYGCLAADCDVGTEATVSELDLHQRNMKIAKDGVMMSFPPQIRRKLRMYHLYVGFDLRDPALRGLLHALSDAHSCDGAIGFAVEPTFEIAEGGKEDAARAFADRYLTDNGPCREIRVLWKFPTKLFNDIAANTNVGVRS